MGGGVIGLCVIFLACILSIPDKVSSNPLPHQYELCTQIKTHVHHHNDKNTAETTAAAATTAVPDGIKNELQKRIKQFRKAFKAILSLELDEDEKKKAEAKKKKEEEAKKKKEEEEQKKKEEKGKKNEPRGFKSIDAFFDNYIALLTNLYYSF